jgi:hypothetical protein
MGSTFGDAIFYMGEDIGADRCSGHPEFDAGQHPDHTGIGDAIFSGSTN